MKQNHKYFSHKQCEFYPCHEGATPDNFNCLFCYCPLYSLGKNCGGNFSYIANDIKDCSNCLLPHENYDYIVKKLSQK